ALPVYAVATEGRDRHAGQGGAELGCDGGPGELRGCGAFAQAYADLFAAGIEVVGDVEDTGESAEPGLDLLRYGCGAGDVAALDHHLDRVPCGATTGGLGEASGGGLREWSGRVSPCA